jgi:hypothetical protein
MPEQTPCNPFNPWFGVGQNILPSWFSPTITCNFAGDIQVEKRVVAEAASYGKQLGLITDIVLALADKRLLDDNPSVSRLRKISEHVEEIKETYRRSAVAEATDALDRLQRESSRDFFRLVKDCYEKLEKDKSDSASDIT